MDCGIYVPYAPPGVNSPFDVTQFIPYKGNDLRVGDEIVKIPHGEEVVSGGLLSPRVGCIINGVVDQQLAPFTLYRDFVFKDALGVLRINRTTGKWHKTCPTHGHEIHEDFPQQTFIGLTYTDAFGRIDGGGSGQMLLSWYNHCRSPLSCNIPWSSYTFDTEWEEIPGVELRYLLMGLNKDFPESLSHPHIYAYAQLCNGVPGASAHISVAIDGVQTGHTEGYYQPDTAGSGGATAVAPGAGGKAEGLHKATAMIRTSANGVAAVMEGTLTTTPLVL